MNKPIPVIILSVLAILNGVAAFVLGTMTLLGNTFVFTPDGIGPNRIAISELFGPLAAQTGWILLLIGMLFMVIGYGLLTFREWARFTLFWGFAVLAGLTVIAVGWAVFHSELGVVIGGLFKVAVEVALCWYLTARNVRSAFSR